MLLGLPIFAPEVPAAIEFSAAGTRHLRLVLSMSRLGMICDEDLFDLCRTNINASEISRLIATGWKRAFGGDYNFQLISAYAQLILPNSANDEEFTSAENEPMVGVAINATPPEWIVVGAAFEAIELECPGLGCTALRYLEEALYHFGMPHSPSGAFEMCQQLYWQGEDDERIVLEEYGDEDIDVPHRADLFEGVPEWAYDTGKSNVSPISDQDFSSHVERLSQHPVGKMLSAILRLQQANKESSNLFAPAYDHDDMTYPNEPPIVLAWRNSEDFAQIFDDNFRYSAEGGEEPPWIGCIKFVPNETGISNAMPLIRHTGLVLSALDEALSEARKLNHVI